MYNPQTYWQGRTDPAPRDLPGYAADYITRHIEDADTLLDFGIGDGRMLPLYEGKGVKGYDIVERLEGVEYLSALEGEFDVAIASKVFLHVPPADIGRTIVDLKAVADKIVVYDTIGPCRAEHNFAHDFNQFGDMEDVEIHGHDLLFVYDIN